MIRNRKGGLIMREKLMRFMSGRYGFDSYGRFTLILAIIFAFVSMFTRSSFCNLLSWVLMIYTYFRIFSRNVYKRNSENQTYLAKTYKIRNWFEKQKRLMQQKKTHHVYKCPTCKQKIRIPKGKGKIEIRCPKCYTTFVKKS